MSGSNSLSLMVCSAWMVTSLHSGEASPLCGVIETQVRPFVVILVSIHNKHKRVCDGTWESQ